MLPAHGLALGCEAVIDFLDEAGIHRALRSPQSAALGTVHGRRRC